MRRVVLSELTDGSVSRRDRDVSDCEKCRTYAAKLQIPVFGMSVYVRLSCARCYREIICVSSNCLTFDQTYCSECVKSELMLESRVQEAGAAESLEIGKSETGASNKSGRCGMRSIKEK